MKTARGILHAFHLASRFEGKILTLLSLFILKISPEVQIFAEE